MKRVILLLALFSCGTSLAFSQNNQPPGPKDRKQINGYTVRVIPAPGGTFGYDILSGERCILHQVHNPFTGSPFGLASREDVYKLATWQIQHAVHAGLQSDVGIEKISPAFRLRLSTMRPRIMHHVPMHVAKELNISLGNQ